MLHDLFETISNNQNHFETPLEGVMRRNVLIVADGANSPKPQIKNENKQGPKAVNSINNKLVYKT